MSLIQPFVLQLESLVYDGVCGLSSLFPADSSDGVRVDVLASPDPGAPRRRFSQH